MFKFIPIVIGGFLMLLTGCAYFGHSKALDKSNKLIVAELNLTKKKQQEAASNVEAARQLLGKEVAPSLPVTVAKKELELAAQNLPQVTPNQLIEINERLTLALSKSEADRVKADERYNAKLHEFQTLRDDQDALVKKHQELETQLAQNDAEAKSRQALIASIIRTLLIAGVVTAIGAVLAFRFFPSLTIPAAVLSGVFFGLSYLAATIEPWMIYTAVALVSAALAAIAIWSHKEKQVGDALTGAMHELKTESADIAPKVEAKVAEWTGGVKTWIGSHIESKAVALNVK